MRAAFLGLCLIFASSTSLADQIYRWAGSDGKTYYGDQPPLNATAVQKIDRRHRSGAESEKSKTKPDVGSGDAEDARAAKCEKTRSQLATYRNASRLVQTDNLGNEREYSEEEKALLIGRTEVEIEVLCGGEIE